MRRIALHTRSRSGCRSEKRVIPRRPYMQSRSHRNQALIRSRGCVGKAQIIDRGPPMSSRTAKEATTSRYYVRVSTYGLPIRRRRYCNCDVSTVLPFQHPHPCLTLNAVLPKVLLFKRRTKTMFKFRTLVHVSMYVPVILKDVQMWTYYLHFACVHI